MVGKGLERTSLLDNKILVAFIFLLLGVALYQSGFDAPWYLDDGNNIVYNPMVKDLPGTLKNIFKPRGVANFTFSLNYHFAGMSSYWFRLTNVAIHVGAALLVWRLLARLYPLAIVSLCGGLLFLVHPLQTQAVTYVVQRMASMAAFFFLFSVYLYFRARESKEFPRSTFWYAAALFSAFLAIWTKQNTVVLPIVILLVDYAIIDQKNFSLRLSLWRAVPFLIFSLLAIFQQFHTSPETFAIMNGEGAQSGAMLAAGEGVLSGVQGEGVGLLDSLPVRYFATQLIVLWLYVKLFFFPYGQMLDYYGTVSIVRNVFNIKTFASIFAWIMVFACIHHFRLWSRRLVFGFSWIILTLVLESSFIPLDPVFEHRMYLPFFGAFIVSYELFFYRVSSQVAGRLAVVILLAFSAMTVQRNALWADPVAFWNDNAEKNPYGTRIMVILAKIYLDRGDYAHAEEWYTKAITIESASADPLAKIRSSNPLDSMGTMRLLQGRKDEALIFYERALLNNPQNAYASANLGKLLYESGQEEKGILHLEQAFKNDPLNRVAINSLFEIYAESGNEAAAERFYRLALVANPFNDQIRVALGLLLDKAGRSAEGLEILRPVLEQYPEEAKYFYYYGLCALHAGDEAAYRIAYDRLQVLSLVFFEKLVKGAEKVDRPLTHR